MTLSLKELLQRKPYEFQFVQAVRLLSIPDFLSTPFDPSFIKKKPIFLLKSRVFFSAPPSDIFKICVDSSTTAQPLTEIHVNFLGLAGIQGPLPLPYTEILLSRLRHQDPAFRDFLDIFNHRLLFTFYRIEQKFHPALHLLPPEKTPLGLSLKALGGWVKKKSDLNRHLLTYTSFFWQKPHNPAALQALIQNFFQAKTKIFGFQGAWMPFQKRQITYLGHPKKGPGCPLGQGATLGKRVWCPNYGILVHLSFKDFETYRTFLPSLTAEAPQHALLKHLIALYVGPAFSFKIQFSVEEKPTSFLGTKNHSIHLGWSSWLGRSSYFNKTPKNQDQTITVVHFSPSPPP